MEIAARMAGFTLGQADLLRRAIGKKKKEILDQQREVFINGCRNKGFSKELARDIYDLILKFASYGFNKSHAAAYAMIAYQTAYLKANYPVEFMAALLTGYHANSDKVALYIADCRRQNIQVLPPDINESETNFTVVGENRIRFGLAAVKNVGLGAIESILEVRRERPFISLLDFATRVDSRLCNRKVVESLIKCGAFDSLCGSRAACLAGLDEVMARGQTAQRERENGQLSMFSLMDRESRVEQLVDRLPDIPEFSYKERLALEKEMLGMYITGHPLEQYRPLLERMKRLTRCAELGELGDGKPVTVGGIVAAMRTIYTKKGLPMAFLTLEDLTGSVEVIVFSDLYQRRSELIQEDNLLIIKGKTDLKEEENAKIIAEAISALPREPKQMYLKVRAGQPMESLLDLKRVLQEHRGGMPVYLYFENKKKMILLSEDYWVEDNPALQEKLLKLLGPGTVKCQELNDSFLSP